MMIKFNDQRLKKENITVSFINTKVNLDTLLTGIISSDWDDPELVLGMLSCFEVAFVDTYQPAWMVAYVDDELVYMYPLFSGDGDLSLFGRYIAPLTRKGINGKTLEIISENILSWYLDFAESEKLTLRVTGSTKSDNNLYGWQTKLLSKGGSLKTQFNGCVDLTQDESEIKKTLRKSYKSLINWGRKNMSLKMIDSNHLDEKTFREFQQFHKVVSYLHL